MKMSSIFNRLGDWYHNLHLNAKILLMVMIVGLIPVTALGTFYVWQLRGKDAEIQKYVLSRGYEQIGSTIESKISMVHNISTQILVDSDMVHALHADRNELTNAEELALFEPVSEFAAALEMTVEGVSIYFYLDDSYLITQGTLTRYRPYSSISSRTMFHQLLQSNDNYRWVILNEKDTGRYSHNYLAELRTIWNNRNYNEAVGVIAVGVEFDEVEKVLCSSAEEETLYLENTEGNILISNGYPVEGEVISAVRNYTTGDYELIRSNDTDYYFRRDKIAGTNLYLVSIVTKDFIYAETKGMLGTIIGACLIVYLITIALALTISRGITGRIYKMVKAITHVGDGKLIQVEGPEYQDEIGTLISGYNNMTNQVEQLLEDREILGSEKAGAELKALQSQINPHFLYNTLDMLGWMSEKGESENIQFVLQSMSSFYRLALSRGKDIITIGEEIELCNSYMGIQTLRFKGRIRYEADVEDDIKGYLIPKITLQPFVENSVIHGINEKPGGRGFVQILGWQEDGRIVLSVVDDGVGMNQKENGNGSSYGLQNIRMRLYLYYKEEIEIHIESTRGAGTCVYVNLPMMKE